MRVTHNYQMLPRSSIIESLEAPSARKKAEQMGMKISRQWEVYSRKDCRCLDGNRYIYDCIV